MQNLICGNPAIRRTLACGIIGFAALCGITGCANDKAAIDLHTLDPNDGIVLMRQHDSPERLVWVSAAQLHLDGQLRLVDEKGHFVPGVLIPANFSAIRIDPAGRVFVGAGEGGRSCAGGWRLSLARFLIGRCMRIQIHWTRWKRSGEASRTTWGCCTWGRRRNSVSGFCEEVDDHDIVENRADERDECLMIGMDQVGIAVFFVLERDHEAVREAFVAVFRADIGSPME